MAQRVQCLFVQWASVVIDLTMVSLSFSTQPYQEKLWKLFKATTRGSSRNKK